MMLEDADFNAHNLPCNIYQCVQRQIYKALQNVRIAYSSLIAAKEEEMRPPKLFS